MCKKHGPRFVKNGQFVSAFMIFTFALPHPLKLLCCSLFSGCHPQERSTLSSPGIPRRLSTTCKQTASLIIQCLTMCAHELTTSTAFGYPSKCILLVFACVVVVIYCTKEFPLFLLELRLCPLDFLFFPAPGKGRPVSGKLAKHYNECCCCRSLCMSVLQCPVAPLTVVQNTCFNIDGVVHAATCKNCAAIASILVGLQSKHYWVAENTAIKVQLEISLDHDSPVIVLV